MSEQQETVFADGMIFKPKREGAPDFVLGSFSFKVEEFVAFLEKYKKDGWVNVDFLRSKPKNEGEKGKPYCKLNTWTPENKEGAQEIKPSDIPF